MNRRQQAFDVLRGRDLNDLSRSINRDNFWWALRTFRFGEAWEELTILWQSRGG